jgi:hypothetical protein
MNLEPNYKLTINEKRQNTVLLMASFSAVRLDALSVSCANCEEMLTFSLMVRCVVTAIWLCATLRNSAATLSTRSIISFFSRSCSLQLLK